MCGRLSEEEFLLVYDKYNSNMYSNNYGDLPRNSSDRDVHYERTRRRGTQRYLRESCYHRVKSTATTFLATFMWKRPLNSIALATTTHRKPKRVSDGTNTQVRAQMTNKYRIKMVQRELYNIRDPPWGGDRKKKRNTVTIKNQTCNRASRLIYRNQSPRTLLRIFLLSVNSLFSFLCHQDLITCCLIY